MGDPIVIKVADFSRYPSGREASDGDYNGSRFRDEILTPAILGAREAHKKIEISLDGVLSFGSSFLEEAFGGLVRKGIAERSFLRKTIEIVSEKRTHDRVRDAIFRYIETAKAP